MGRDLKAALGSGAAEHEDAARIATRAGYVLVRLRSAAAGNGTDAKHLGEEGDRRSHEFIVRALRRLYPRDAILSEEGAEDPGRLEARRVWIVDPLDGTREFGESGRTDWAVHVALAVDGRLAAGAVALPALGLTLATAPAPRLLSPGTRGRPRLVVSRTRPPAVAVSLAESLGADLVPMGSAGAKTMSVVRGEADVYVHAGGQYEWDSAAPAAVACAAGLHVSRIDGGVLRYNQRDPWLPDFLACRPELAEAIIAALREAS